MLLDHSEIELGGIRHHVGRPGWIPDQVELRGSHTRNAARLGLDLGGKHFRCMTFSIGVVK